jgi:hypothetical protein
MLNSFLSSTFFARKHQNGKTRNKSKPGKIHTLHKPLAKPPEKTMPTTPSMRDISPASLSATSVNASIWFSPLSLGNVQTIM